MADHSRMKLGKRTPHHDPRTLQMAKYLKAEYLPQIPDAKDWTPQGVDWGMMLNDNIGDCTCAAAGHLIMEWTGNTGKVTEVPDNNILQAYEAVSGYDPSDPQSDQGAVETDVLNYWRQSGISGHKILAYAALEPNNQDHVRLSIWLFGGCYIGLALPFSAQTQDVWAVPPGGTVASGAPSSWGGHAVPVVAYDQAGLTVITWGAAKRMTWGFWQAYCDEAYAVLSDDFMKNGPNGMISPNGIDLNTLTNDLSLVSNS